MVPYPSWNLIPPQVVPISPPSLDVITAVFLGVFLSSLVIFLCLVRRALIRCSIYPRLPFVLSRRLKVAVPKHYSNFRHKGASFSFSLNVISSLFPLFMTRRVGTNATCNPFLLIFAIFVATPLPPCRSRFTQVYYATLHIYYIYSGPDKIAYADHRLSSLPLRQ